MSPPREVTGADPGQEVRPPDTNRHAQMMIRTPLLITLAVGGGWAIVGDPSSVARFLAGHAAVPPLPLACLGCVNDTTRCDHCRERQLRASVSVCEAIQAHPGGEYVPELLGAALATTATMARVAA